MHSKLRSMNYEAGYGDYGYMETYLLQMWAVVTEAG